MWICQEASNQPCLPSSSVTELSSAVLAGSGTSEPEASVEPMILASFSNTKTKETLQTRSVVPRTHTSVSKDCLLLTGAYLFGTFLSGVVQALCNGTEKDILSYYLSSWQNLFTVADAAGLPRLFGTELWSVLGALLVLFFLGLSAIGSLFIFLFVMLYGIGAGLLFLQWMTAGISLRSLGLLLLAAGLPVAIAACGLCLFGASALQVSSRIQAFSFRKREEAPHKVGAGLLIGQFAVTATAFIPLCGMATGLAYLAYQFVS